MFESLRGKADSIGLTSDIFRLVAGPWMSIEEAKVVFVFEAPMLPFFPNLPQLLRMRPRTEAARFVAAMSGRDGRAVLPCPAIDQDYVDVHVARVLGDLVEHSFKDSSEMYHKNTRSGADCAYSSRIPSPYGKPKLAVK